MVSNSSCSGSNSAAHTSAMTSMVWRTICFLVLFLSGFRPSDAELPPAFGEAHKTSTAGVEPAGSWDTDSLKFIQVLYEERFQQPKVTSVRRVICTSAYINRPTNRKIFVRLIGYVQLDVAMLNVTKYEGETVRIRCEITGFPLPRYRWRHNGALIPDSSDAERGRRDVKTTPWGSRLKIEDLGLIDSGVYTCEGHNSFDQQSTTGHLDIIPGSNPNRESNAGQQRNRLSSSSADEDEEMEAMETNIDVKYDDMDEDWIGKWDTEEEEEDEQREHGDDGDWSSIEPTKKTRHHSKNNIRKSTNKLSLGGIDGSCQRYHGNLCSRFISNRSSIFVAGDRARQSLIESHLAATLTLLATSSDGSTDCLEAALPFFCRYTFPECDVSRTKLSAKLCREECEQFENGICREPYKRVKEHNPTEGPVVLIDCQRLTSSQTDCVSMTSSERRAAKNSKDKMDATLFIVLPSVGLPFLVVMATILVLLCCRTSRTGSASSAAATAKATSIGGGATEVDPMLFNRKRRTPLIEVPAADVTLLRELGEGAYGRLYAGSIYIAPTASDCSAAFIKVLSDRSDAEVVRQEALRLLEINHPNIVRIFGLSLGLELHEPTCMLYEYMESVDLHQFLLLNAELDEQQDRTRLSIARQVAAAAEYLTSRGLVHRDLAARNVLVSPSSSQSSPCAKLSDFGLCRYPYDNDYYPMDDGSLLPVRWMSPEALQQGQFSEASDVWSFGVLLWEIYNPGAQPYVGQSDEEVIEAVGMRRLGPFVCVERCPQRISALAVDCWNDQPYRRPRFRDIHEMLLHHLEANDEEEKGAEEGQQQNDTPTSSNNNTASTSVSPTLPCPLFASAPYYYPLAGAPGAPSATAVPCYMPLLASSPTSFVGPTGRMLVNRFPLSAAAAASMPNSPAKMPLLPPLPPPPPLPPQHPHLPHPHPAASFVNCSNQATANGGSNGNGKYWHHWSAPPPPPSTGPSTVSNVV